MNLRSNRAITLVALIVTIIILLILAGVSLSMVLGDNGLINKAQSGVDKYQQSANNEQAMLNSIEAYFKEYMPGEKMPLPGGWDETKVTAISDGKHNIIPLPKDFYYVGGNLDNGVVISDNLADKYDGTVDKTTWEYTTNLVGNQFVWIPCTEEEYHKTDWGESYVSGVYDTTGPSDDEKSKVLKYGGFYVARYEAGLADGIDLYDIDYPSWEAGSPGYNLMATPKSQGGKIPWIFIDYNTSKANAENWYASSSSVESGLITGTQWDVMLNKLIGTTNENGVFFTENDLKNSERWGNYINNDIPYKGKIANTYVNENSVHYITPFTTIISTGTTEMNKRNTYTTGASKVAESYHIYDVAGNVGERTEEIGGPKDGSATSGYRVARGGDISHTFSDHPACYRYANRAEAFNVSDISFRTVLYIK